MKILLSLSLLFISCIVCKGQNKKLDSILSMMRDSGVATYGIGTVTTLHRDADSVWLSSDSTMYYYIYEKPKQDTLKIIYQYSDTSKIVEFETSYSIDTTTGEVSSTPTLVNSMGYYDNKVRWSNGYVVTESTIYSFRRVCYLDKDKQPLYKNIIVWKYIEIE